MGFDGGAGGVVVGGAVVVGVVVGGAVVGVVVGGVRGTVVVGEAFGAAGLGVALMPEAVRMTPIMAATTAAPRAANMTRFLFIAHSSWTFVLGPAHRQ
jgi:hypothetical protein